MHKRITYAIALVMSLALAGCAGNADAIKVAVKMMSTASELAPGLHYVQATGGFNIAPLNSIVYKHAGVKVDGSDITVLVSSASPEFWAELTKIVTGGVLNLGQAALLGVSFPAAKMAISQANTQTGAGATATTGTINNTAEGGKADATGGAGGKADATGGAGGTGCSGGTGSTQNC